MPEFDDPRLTVPADFADARGRPFQVSAGVVAVRRAPAPDAEMVTQALHGETLRVFVEQDEFALVQLDRDRYVGWALVEALSAPPVVATHSVVALRTYAYSEPNLKSAPTMLISLGARVSAEGEAEKGFLSCARAGWVHAAHLQTAEAPLPDDPAGVAEGFLGAPYLWGGRESLGLDCTGLTVAAFGACGAVLPRDSDMQFAWSGAPIDDWQRPDALRRSDLVFWEGHVGIMLDAERFLHANAHHMAVAVEPLAGAVERIARLYGKPIGACRIDLATARRTPAWLDAI